MVGKILGGRYEILEQIGKGGMAVVYKARCRRLNRIVAIKVLREDLTENEEFVKRFNVEAQAAASLTHPNIVSVYDVGKEGKIHYIVMEYVEGVTLKQYIEKKGRIPWREAVSITIEICHGLAKAHEKHIIHRDIKPHNIIVTSTGAIKVTDFGIARATTTSTVSASDDVLGSVHYFSPEQARGGYVDEKSDIYSLGVVMYEMLTGKVPFTGDTPVAVAMKQIEEAPKSICEQAPDVPQCVEGATFKAMAKETRCRYQSVGSLADDLYAILKNPNLDASSVVNAPISDDADATIKIAPVKKNEEIDDVPRRKVSKEAQSKKGDKKAVIFAMITSLLIVGVLTVVFGFMFFGSQNSGNITVPSVIGKTLEDAEKVAKENNAVIEVLEYKESDKEDGTIIEQSPKAGMTVATLEKISVVISGKEPTEITLSDYKGQDFSSAEKELLNLGLKVIKEEEESDSVDNGKIIRQNPSAKTKVEKGDSVTLYVSKGKSEEEEFMVPQVVGKSYDEAKSEIEAAGFITEKVEKYSDKAMGTVISQSINGGAKKGSTVTLTVSKGSESTQTPSTQTPSEKTKTLTIDLSSYSKPVEIKIVTGGRVVSTVTVDPTKTPEYSAKLKGTGTKTFEVHIDGVKQVTKTVNFD